MSVGVGEKEGEETSATCYSAHIITPSDLLGISKMLNGRKNAADLVVIPLRQKEI